MNNLPNKKSRPTVIYLVGIILSGALLCPVESALAQTNMFAPVEVEVHETNLTLASSTQNPGTVEIKGSSEIIVDQSGHKILVISGQDSGPQNLPAQGNEPIPGITIPAQGQGNEQNSTEIQVSQEGHKTLLIQGAEGQAETLARPPSSNNFAPTPEPQNNPSQSKNSEIKVDEKGHKTLSLQGAEGQAEALNLPPPATFTPAPKPKDNSRDTDDSGIEVDEKGHRTLVIKENQSTSKTGKDMNLTTPVSQRPYWLPAEPPASTQRSSTQPYYQAVKVPQTETKPYWEIDQTQVVSSPQPYWLVKKESRDNPYWAPAVKPRPEIIVAKASISTPTSTGARTPAVTNLMARPDTISYYMYQDAAGVKHLSNTPVDKRYRMVTFAVALKIQRGLAGISSRFTHETLREVILKAARVHNLDPALIAAVIRAESAFDANAVSWAGAQGLMQLMPGTARDMKVRNPFNPEDNVMGGSRYLRRMLTRFNGDLTLALAAYNAGPTRVARLMRVPNIPETKNYVKIVQRNYQQYKGQF